MSVSLSGVEDNINNNPVLLSPSTTTTTSSSTTKKPINFRLKSRERMIRNRHRARNPHRSRVTTRRPDTTEEPQKPNLFDPFSGAQQNNLQISPSFASNPSFSQEKINAFANLLAVVNNVEESSSPVPSIGSVSLGEGGMVAHDMDDDDVEAVTSRRVNQFEFFTPKSVQGLR